MQKIYAKCRICGAKIRIRKDDLESDYYIISGGTVAVVDDKLYFYCSKHALKELYPEIR